MDWWRDIEPGWDRTITITTNECECCLSVVTSVEGRVVHLDKDSCEKCTDDKFNQSHYSKHQKELKPLAHLGIQCVTKFPLDHMHTE